MVNMSFDKASKSLTLGRLINASRSPTNQPEPSTGINDVNGEIIMDTKIETGCPKAISVPKDANVLFQNTQL